MIINNILLYILHAIIQMSDEPGRVTKIELGQDNQEMVYLDLIKKSESPFEVLPAMKAEWLEAVPVVVRLHDKLSKLNMKLGNLFVDAAEEDDLYLLKELLENYRVSVDVDHKSTPGLTALHYACLKGHVKVVKWLLEQKADIEREDEKGRTGLVHAVEAGNVDVLKILVSNGAELNAKSSISALHKAILKRQTDCAEILIDNGCNVNQQVYNLKIHRKI